MPIGPLMIDVSGETLTDEEYEILQHPMIGGVILFTRNYKSTTQLTNLIYSIRDCRKGPILIAVDHEGGRVQRFREGFTELPPAGKYGEIYDKNPDLALQLLDKTGWLMAIELLTVGVDISFAPVLDVDQGISEVIGNRSFHANPEVVATLAKALISGMNRAGMKAVGKHFPGHGSVIADSHQALPIDEREPEEIIALDMLPFIKLARSELSGIMTAHIVFKKLDSEAVTFSKFWLQKVLRGQASFPGVIFSDDLSMAGAEIIGNYPTRVERALEAGCDMVLVCNNRTAVIEVLEKVTNYSDPLSQQRLLKMCGRFHYTRTELSQSPAWQEIAAEIKGLLEKDVTT